MLSEFLNRYLIHRPFVAQSHLPLCLGFPPSHLSVNSPGPSNAPTYLLPFIKQSPAPSHWKCLYRRRSRKTLERVDSLSPQSRGRARPGAFGSCLLLPWWVIWEREQLDHKFLDCDVCFLPGPSVTELVTLGSPAGGNGSTKECRDCAWGIGSREK